MIQTYGDSAFGHHALGPAVSLLGGGWGWFALAFLLPDVSMLGYLAGPRRGAAVYDLAHTTLLPAALGAAGWAGTSRRRRRR